MCFSTSNVNIWPLTCGLINVQCSGDCVAFTRKFKVVMVSQCLWFACFGIMSPSRHSCRLVRWVLMKKNYRNFEQELFDHSCTWQQFLLKKDFSIFMTIEHQFYFLRFPFYSFDFISIWFRYNYHNWLSKPMRVEERKLYTVFHLFMTTSHMLTFDQIKW